MKTHNLCGKTMHEANAVVETAAHIRDQNGYEYFKVLTATDPKPAYGWIACGEHTRGVWSDLDMAALLSGNPTAFVVLAEAPVAGPEEALPGVHCYFSKWGFVYPFGCPGWDKDEVLRAAREVADIEVKLLAGEYLTALAALRAVAKELEASDQALGDFLSAAVKAGVNIPFPIVCSGHLFETSRDRVDVLKVKAMFTTRQAYVI